ncbi:erythromycin esterase family protein [Micromonospora sp. DT48]|uniref:erythromycin esterase family protein n=1 Tax=unclassified Micromonospora TaxID=2617518 RepID=UPI0012BD123E|nr:erythromycin esterase family protein [Micromonospora sp. CP22]MTK05131.1 erythromycin esterase family protein [Micromonospora sp. CP22]
MALRDRTAVLRTLDPAEPDLTDLAPLRTLLAGARVVGVGEGSHFVREFTLARARLLRYLVEECGLTILAFELGASEADALNPWLAGDGDDADLHRLAGPLTAGLFGELLSWLRRYNRSRPHPLGIVGIDLPNTLTLRPDLQPVADYLRGVDSEAAELLDRLFPVADEISGGSAAVSAPQWSALDPARQDALAAGLARLSLRMRALQPVYLSRSDPDRYATARRHLDAACHTEYMLRAMSDLFSGEGLPGDTSIRDHFMAATVQWHLSAAGPDARMAVVAHNNHIQKTPVCFDGTLTALPMGHYLAHGLGRDYRAVALTHTGDRVPEMAFPADGSPVGFTVEDVDVPAPAPGSVEQAVLDAGFTAKITLTDPRAAESPLASIRTQSAALETDVRQAFDAVLTTPTATRDHTVAF